MLLLLLLMLLLGDLLLLMLLVLLLVLVMLTTGRPFMPTTGVLSSLDPRPVIAGYRYIGGLTGDLHWHCYSWRYHTWNNNRKIVLNQLKNHQKIIDLWILLVIFIATYRKSVLTGRIFFIRKQSTWLIWDQEPHFWH